MDEIVRAALLKWPNVPHCFGWLALDARGEWYMRDDQVQAAGPFPRVKGSRIVHEKLRDFIERNYTSDEAGSWFFQNGPQRVYVTLEAAPFVWRLDHARTDSHRSDARSAEGSGSDPFATGVSPSAGPELVIETRDGHGARFESCWLDESGRLFLATDLGFGLVHSLDMHLAAGAVERGEWVPQEASFTTLVERFGYCLTPAP
jgi:hypothetical protein